MLYAAEGIIGTIGATAGQRVQFVQEIFDGARVVIEQLIQGPPQ